MNIKGKKVLLMRTLATDVLQFKIAFTMTQSWMNLLLQKCC